MLSGQSACFPGPDNALGIGKDLIDRMFIFSLFTTDVGATYVEIHASKSLMGRYARHILCVMKIPFLFLIKSKQ